MKILIADDDPQMLRALRITLSARGYTVVTASTGTEATTSRSTRTPTCTCWTSACRSSTGST